MTETALGRRRLGRGLEALLGPTREEAEREGSLVELPVREIRPNPFQPRQDVDAASLEELKSSIQRAGLLQPVVVRTAAGGGYELIAGERRLRACQALGWERVPAGKRGGDRRTVLTLALIENLQRHDLSPVDEARGYDPLLAEFRLPPQDVAGAAAAPQARSGAGARGAAHRRGAAPPAGYRRAGHTAREREGADPRRVLL